LDGTVVVVFFLGDASNGKEFLGDCETAVLSI